MLTVESLMFISAHNFKQKMQENILRLAKEYESEGYEVLLIKDMNVVLNIADCNGILHHVHTSKDFIVHRTRVDLGIVIRGIFDKGALLGSEILDGMSKYVATTNMTNHIPIKVDLGQNSK